MLLSVMSFLRANIPFIFIDVPSTATRAPNKGISPKALCIITSYREHYRRLYEAADAAGVELTKVG
ncbi:unnamed protein product [Strongylus vulgaris]|uniref:Uncharacterized protein n=1 Tax=Strongylus vulgaris TaxID=40348 RepID=A0A3P7J1J6_STRVU|nr:unnamed protein product [Strongylus vulgaris]